MVELQRRIDAAYAQEAYSDASHIAAMRALATIPFVGIANHYLKKGDHLVRFDTHTHFQPSPALYLIGICDIDHGDLGDFLTVDDATGPISGNLFVDQEGIALLAGSHVFNRSFANPEYDTVEQDMIMKFLRKHHPISKLVELIEKEGLAETPLERFA